MTFKCVSRTTPGMQRYQQQIVHVTARCGHAVSVRLFGWDNDQQHKRKLDQSRDWCCTACAYTANKS